MKKQKGWKFSWILINGEAQITAGRMEHFLKINKRVYPSIWDLRVEHIIICKSYYYKNVLLLCWSDHFLDSRAEICQIFRWFFGKYMAPKRHSEFNWPLQAWNYIFIIVKWNVELKLKVAILLFILKIITGLVLNNAHESLIMLVRI